MKAEPKMLERPMTDQEVMNRKEEMANKMMEMQRLEEEVASITMPRKDVIKQLKLEITQLRREIQSGVVTERNPDWVGKSD